MMEAGIAVGLLVLIVIVVTFGMQAAIILLQGALLLLRLLWQVGLALAWCVIWVFNRKAAMEAWRKSDG